MILTILIPFILLMPCLASGTCEKHPIYCQMMMNLGQAYSESKIESSYGHGYLMRVSNIIHKVTARYDLVEERELFTDILMQESFYRQDAMHCVGGLSVDRMTLTEEECEGKPLILKCRMAVPELGEKEVCQDFGIAMINYRTATLYGFSVRRIMSDLEYAISCGAKVLSDLKKSYKGEPGWWTRYNAVSDWKRAGYEMEVSKWRKGRKESRQEQTSSRNTKGGHPR